MGLLTAIGLGASAIGSALAAKSTSKAAGKAADTSLQVARENNALAKDIYGENKATLAPYVGAGLQPTSLIAGGLGYGDQGAYQNAFKNFIGNSDYGFQFGQGANAINSGYAGAGTLQSGAAMKGLEDYRQNLQAGYRGEFNAMLGGQQSVGLNAAGAQAGVATNYGNAVMANNTNAGNAAANALLIKGQNNPFASALGAFGGGVLGMGR